MSDLTNEEIIELLKQQKAKLERLKKAVRITDIIVLIIWIINGITTLLHDDISKVQYICCLFSLLHVFGYKTFMDFQKR